MAGTHALLAPSAAHRWLNCTPSARLEEGVEDNGSEFAEEGTCAHALCEIKLRDLLNEEADTSEYDLLSQKWFDKAMDEYTDEYATQVYSRYLEILKQDSSAILRVEEKLNFSSWIPNSFGTCDAMIVSNDVIEVFDFKYGKGVPVSSENNPQMMIYALGAIADHELTYDFKTVRMTIIQPRISNTSSWEIPIEELKHWADTELKTKAQLANQGAGEAEPGPWCQFCKIKGRCATLANKMMACYSKYENKALITDEQMPDILALIPTIKTWCSAVEDLALAQALSGTKFNGYKLVEGRSVRKISNEKLLIERLIDAGEAPADIFKPATLCSITDLEKLVGKKQFAKLSEGCLERPSGKPTLVPSSDKRQEIYTNSAIEDFKDIIID